MASCISVALPSSCVSTEVIASASVGAVAVRDEAGGATAATRRTSDGGLSGRKPEERRRAQDALARLVRVRDFGDELRAYERHAVDVGRLLGEGVDVGLDRVEAGA